MNRRIVATVVALFLMGVVMSTTAQRPAKRQYVRLAGRATPPPFSDGVMVGNTLYLAGKIGIDPATGRPPDDLEKEIRLMMDGIQATLKEAGMTMEDVTYVQVFCSDVSLYGKFNAVYRTYFPSGNFPARAFLGSGPLLFGAHFEVQAIAVKD